MSTCERTPPALDIQINKSTISIGMPAGTHFSVPGKGTDGAGSGFHFDLRSLGYMECQVDRYKLVLRRRMDEQKGGDDEE